MTAEPLKQIVFNLDDFKSCPCCGSEVDVKMVGALSNVHNMVAACTTDLAKITIYCSECGLQSKPFEFSPEGISSTIAAWNRRAELLKDAKELPPWLIERLKNTIYGHKQAGDGKDYRDGYQAALEWVLSLKKGDS